MKLFAHRGVMALLPENTMSAFELALTSGADGIETDVHLTKDGELVLIHDETLDRTTDGYGAISQHTLSELKQFNAGVRFGMNEPIPTLDELLMLLKGTDKILNLEVKTDVERYEGIEALLIEKLRMHNVDSERIIFSSFNHMTVHHLKKLSPSTEGAILLSQPLYDVAGYMKQVGADSIHPHIDVMTDKEISSLQSQNISIRPYTIKNSRQLDKCVRNGVDAVFVNDIEWARARLTL